MNVYAFWTGTNEMSETRKQCLKTLSNTQCDVWLVTPNNLHQFLLEDHPLHEAYQYLSETHKSDYLRTYFMHFYGGGYTDIKTTSTSWIESFSKLYASNAWINGYPEIPTGVAYKPAEQYWNELVGNGAYICKPNTPLTLEWYSEMIKLMDDRLERLREHPATHPRDCAEYSEYPIEWNEMLGRIFHKVCYKYRHKLLRTLPAPQFENYI